MVEPPSLPYKRDGALTTHQSAHTVYHDTFGSEEEEEEEDEMQTIQEVEDLPPLQYWAAGRHQTKKNKAKSDEEHCALIPLSPTHI